MSTATQLVDDGTGIFDYQLVATRFGGTTMTKDENADRPPTAQDFLRGRRSAHDKSKQPGRHRDPNSHGLFGRITGRRRDQNT
jgi:hypothetical protein